MALTPSSGWLYYKQIDISDSGSDSADYQKGLTIYSGNGDDNTASGIIYCDTNCESFANDIRFGTTNDPSTATQLKQWIESSDSTEARIWVKLPADGSNTFYMFIGNSTASEESSGTDTWVWFEDWSVDHTGTYTEIRRDIRDDYGHFNDNEQEITAPFRYLNKFKVRIFLSHTYAGQASFGFANDEDSWSPNNKFFFSVDADIGRGASGNDSGTALYVASSGTGSRSGYITWDHTMDTFYIGEINIVSSTSASACIYDEKYTTVEKSGYSVTSNVPTTLDRSYFQEYAAQYCSHYWGYDSTNDLINYGIDYKGDCELGTSWAAVGKYAATKPTWSTFGAWTSLAPSYIPRPTVAVGNPLIL